MSDTPRCPNCGGPVVIAHPISSAEPLHICIACSPAEPDKLDLILDELKAIRASLAVPVGELLAVESISPAPALASEIASIRAELQAMKAEAAAQNARAAFLLSRFDGIAPKRPEPIGMDELGFPIFAEALVPPAVQSPCAPIAGAAPQSSPSPARP